MSTTISDGIPPLQPEMRKNLIPIAAAALALGANENKHWHGNKDAVGIEFVTGIVVLNAADHKLAKEIGDELRNTWVRHSKFKADLKEGSPSAIFDLIGMAQRILARHTDSRAGKKGVIMLKDRSGSGWWRMTLPAQSMSTDGIWLDVTNAKVEFERLLEYDLVMVQRTHDWESYHILKKMKDCGKKLIYDIDDDMFSIPVDNPASRIIGRDEQFAAAACMELADVVTVTTELLGKRMCDVVPGIKMVEVLPNSLDCDDGWLKTELIGSPDGMKRIFWQGSATHAEDWNECIEAVDQIMKDHDNVVVVILGFLPPAVQTHLHEPHWKGRVEFMGFNDAETYYKIIHHVRADVGIAPLRDTPFAASKSPIKFVEYSLIGMPTVASNCEPYSSIIENKDKAGWLASGTAEWYNAIKWAINNRQSGREMVEAAREVVRDKFDLKKTVKGWEKTMRRLLGA